MKLPHQTLRDTDEFWKKNKPTRLVEESQYAEAPISERHRNADEIYRGMMVVWIHLD